MSDATTNVLTKIEEASRQLIAGTQPLRWEWDDRFSAARLVVQAADAPRILALVRAQFSGGAWQSTTIKQAPALARTLAGKWGGLQQGQELFAADLADVPLLFASWWPWSGGATFSLRVGADTRGAALEMSALLRRCFSL